MKKLTKYLSLILCCAFAMMTFAACGNKDQNDEHSTDYKSYVSNGSLGHCGVYEDGTVDYKYSYAHKWEGEECTVCGQKKTTVDNGSGSQKPGDTNEKDVGNISIVTNPAKMKYWIGETFSPEGGVIKITYKDFTEDTKPMTDSMFAISDVKTTSAGRKTVTITLAANNKIKTTLTITVQEKGQNVTFNYNYVNAPESEVVIAPRNGAVDEPANPVREGYTFTKWYIDADCTVEYDFNTVVTKATTLYADWQENGATYYTFTYDLNYYGVKLRTYEQSVKSGEASRALAVTPERNEFSFEGWYTTAECSTAYTQNTAVTQSTTVYAKWVKTKTGSSTYIFEAEKTNLDGKEGLGLSGSAAGKAMVIDDVNNLGASGGKFVSYLYKEGLSVDFEIASSEEVSDAVLTVRLSTEFTFNLNPGMYAVEVNGTKLSYNDVTVVSNMQFSDAIVIEGVHLNKGSNTIKLITANNTNPVEEGAGTYKGTAPTIDCIKITTTAVVTWDGVKSLPRDNT